MHKFAVNRLLYIQYYRYIRHPDHKASSLRSFRSAEPDFEGHGLWQSGGYFNCDQTGLARRPDKMVYHDTILFQTLSLNVDPWFSYRHTFLIVEYFIYFVDYCIPWDTVRRPMFYHISLSFYLREVSTVDCSRATLRRGSSHLALGSSVTSRNA